jgi:predicted SAM-dependent methyltransferase
MVIKLHLGCGKKNFGDEWDHIDGSKYSHIKSHDIINLPYEENTVDLIYASHVFEYFDRDEATSVLQKWKKVLKDNGTLRLAVPDFEACAKLYTNKNVPLSKFVGMFYGKWNMDLENMDSCNQNPIYHKTIYDYNSLYKVLDDNGFSNIKRWEWREVDHGHIDDYSQAYLPHMDKENGTLVSLNVECYKYINII